MAEVTQSTARSEVDDISSKGRIRSSDIGMANHLGEIDATKPSGICWTNYPDEPWHIGWYFTVRGQESLHVYLWIMKDLSWYVLWRT